MYVNKKFLTQYFSESPTKDEVNAMSFFFFMKSRYSNSLVYNFSDSPRKGYEKIAKHLDCDYRTVKKHIEFLTEKGLVIMSYGHLKLVSVEKHFDYRLKENGKTDRKWKSKFFRVRFKETYTLKMCRNIVRGMLVKVLFQKIYFAQGSINCDQISEKEKNRRLRLAFDMRARRDVDGENSHVKIGIVKMGKLMGCSKSTAGRVVDGLCKARIVVRKFGGYAKIGNVSDLKCASKEMVRQIKYGAFCFKDVVLKKECNSYIF